MMKFNPEQRQAIYGEEPFIIVAAGAGSGKTRVLTERYVYLCECKLKSELDAGNDDFGAAVHEIVTLTFTEDAALEMKGRIRKRLLEKRKQAELDAPHEVRFWEKQIESLDTAVISTFHSFCQRIVKENTLEADVFPNFQVMDDTESRMIKSEIFSELIERAERHQQWPLLLESIHPKALRDSLFSVYGKIREYEISESIEQNLQLEEIVATWRAMAKEGLEQFEQDFYRFFQSQPETSKFSKGNKKIFSEAQEIYQLNLHGDALFHRLRDGIPSLKKTVPKSIQKQNEDFYQLMNQWLTVREFLTFPMVEEVLLQFHSLLLELDELYEQKKREAALLDFSDLQQKAIHLLSRPEIKSYYSTLYKHFLVDEMQDTNQLQLRMIEKINPSYRFIVGDGKQSIYRFRGADVEIFNRLIQQAKENPAHSFIDMNTNYRTCESIIQFVNLLFEEEHLMGASPGEMEAFYKTEYSPMTASRNKEKEKETRVEYIKVSEEQEKTRDENQYMMMARRMVELEKEEVEIYDKDEDKWCPVQWRDMAVLMASRTNLSTLEAALKEYDIPYNVYGGLGFYERQEVVDFISLLRWLNKPYEPMYMMAVLRGPLFGVTMDEFLELQHLYGEQSDLASFIYEKEFRKYDLDSLQTKLEAFLQLYEKWTPFSWTSSVRVELLRLFADSGFKTVLLLQKNNLMKVKNVEKLIDTIADFRAKSMEEMLTKLSVLADLSEKEGDAEVELTGGNFVHIMTVHGSKGLEFPVVFIPNLSKDIQSDKDSFRYDVKGGLSVKFDVENNEELLADAVKVTSPNFEENHAMAKDQAVEESKRLFYVALTRARDYLILTSKNKGNKNTWFSWLEEALENSEALNAIVIQKDGVPEQKGIKDMKQVYDGPHVKQARAIPISFSVSEVMSYVNDHDGFLEKHIFKLDPTVMNEEDTKLDDKIVEESALLFVHSSINPKTLGTLVHRICELIDKGFSEAEAYDEALQLIKREEREDYLKEVTPLVKSYQKMTYGNPVENEWEFVVNIKGVNIIGEIDKVIEKNGRLEMIDLKTNRVKDHADELVSYYTPQLYLYKIAYETVEQKPIEKMSLAFLRQENEGLYEVPYDPAYEKNLLSAIREMAELKRNFTSRHFS